MRRNAGKIHFKSSFAKSHGWKHFAIWLALLLCTLVFFMASWNLQWATTAGNCVMCVCAIWYEIKSQSTKTDQHAIGRLGKSHSLCTEMRCGISFCVRFRVHFIHLTLFLMNSINSHRICFAPKAPEKFSQHKHFYCFALHRRWKK